MKSIKKSLVAVALLAAFMVWAQTSHSFRLDRFLEELEKPQDPKPAENTTQPAQQPSGQTQQQPPAQKGQGGLIGLGESLGIFDKKTSKILKGSVGALQALQPIGIKEEKAIGGSLAVEVFSRYGGMVDNPELQRYVTLVGQAVADVSDRPDLEYHFAVLNTEHPNAFATPGGYVFVSIGLLRLLQNEAQLAGVLGHEIAHITQKHALQTLQRSKLLQGVSSLTLAAMDRDTGLFDRVINQVSEVLFTRGLDKNLEFEADKLGAEFAYRTGYFPGGLKDFIKILGKSESRGSSIFLSTHPSPGERYRQLGRHMVHYKSAMLYPVLSKRFRTTVKGRL